jgi:hypothetical protein
VSGPENTFIASVHRHLPSESELYRMKNNNMFNSGIADCWYSAARDLWIEWKFVIVPKRDDTMIDLHAGKKPAMTALQREWLRRRHEEGRNVWVGIGSKDGGVILTDPRYWEQPFDAAWFRAKLFPRYDLACKIAAFCQGK